MTNWKYLLHSGKNSKLKYYGLNFLRLALPDGLYRMRRRRVLAELERRPDRDYILDRVDYYCKLNRPVPLPPTTGRIADFHRKGHRSVYFFDSYQYVRWFPRQLQWDFLFGDVREIPPVPAVVKSRPLCEGNENSVLLNMDKVRHFVFLNDRIPFARKADRAIFRGEVLSKENRIRFMERWFGDPACDLGDVSRHVVNPAWQTGMLTLYDHLTYKFVLALEGNDVASNLKWVMSSNSLAVMPRPTCETWFMEGRLVPDYHYVEIRPDFADLRERMQHYIDHPDEAEAILRHAQEWVAQFRDRRRERLISLLVMDKYFRSTGQECLL